MEEHEDSTAINLAEERLRLEREALAVERERLAAARQHAEEEARLAQTRRRPVLAFVAVALLGALCFAGGMLAGISIMEGRQQRLAEARLAHALSKLNVDPLSVTTNSVHLSGAKTGPAHRNVEVMVIQ
ncbi:MAG: hypothetical protein IJI36_13385 [Kiritimatiellae bacterium]|nr:hypothetical protein [Kiritimatiellia bacterium]